MSAVLIVVDQWHTVRGTKRQAQEELVKLLHQVGQGAYVDHQRLTVGSFLEKWLVDHAASAVTGKTYERYAEICRRHLTPALGHLPLSKLQPLHIQDYYARALRSGALKGGCLSPQTVLHHHRVLRAALHQAVRWQLIVRNPADAADPPKPDRKEMRALSEEQTARLLQLAEESRLYTPILLAVATGVRRGELLALRWQDVDFEHGTIAVRRAIEQTRTAGIRFKSPKTARSERTVALPSLCVAALRRHKAEQSARKLSLGSAYQDLDLVFAAADGTVWKPDVLTRAYRSLVAGTEFAGLRFHDLRHSHATQLLRQGIHPKVVSERLGHSTIGITLDTYSHVLPGMQEQAASKLDSALRTAMGLED